MNNNQNLGLSAAAAFDTQNLDQLKLQLAALAER